MKKFILTVAVAAMVLSAMGGYVRAADSQAPAPTPTTTGTDDGGGCHHHGDGQ